MRIEDHPFFHGLAPERAGRLAAKAKRIHFEPGELVFNEGGESDCLYLLLDGTVEFLKRVGEDLFHTVSTAGAGEFFGEIGVIMNEPRSLRATATSPTELATLEKEELEDFISDTSGPVALTLRSIIRHLHHTTAQFMDEVLQREKMAVVGNMVNSILHDFKNPVTYIRYATDYLARQHNDAATAEICEKVQLQIDRMLDMAEEVIQFSRGDYRPSFALVRLPALMQKFRENNFLDFDNEAVDISIDVEDVEFEAEEGKLIRVFQNLVRNAIDARPDGGLEIRIKGTARGDNVHLAISDNAGGIPEIIRTHFFEPFVTHGKKRGTGLGAAIAKSIVEAHGGNISFESETGAGTTFHLHLPLRQNTG